MIDKMIGKKVYLNNNPNMINKLHFQSGIITEVKDNLSPVIYVVKLDNPVFNGVSTIKYIGVNSSQLA